MSFWIKLLLLLKKKKKKELKSLRQVHKLLSYPLQKNLPLLMISPHASIFHRESLNPNQAIQKYELYSMSLLEATRT